MRLYFRLLAVQFRAQLQYRWPFVLEMLSTALLSATSILTLAAVFARFDHIGGWTLMEVAFLYGLVETAFGTMDMVFSAYDPDSFTVHLQRGTFDQFLLRPVSLPLQLFGSQFALRRLGRILQGALVLGLSLYFTQAHWTLAKGLYLPIVFLSVVAFFGGLFVCGATICFWTVQSIEAVNIFTYGGTEMASYPMHIYPDALRRFFTFVIPAALIVYYPALYFLDKPDPTGMPSWTPFLAPLAGFGVLAAAFGFWSLGVRKYASTGT